MRINVEKCEKMIKNIKNEQKGQIYPTKSQKPGCLAQEKEKKSIKKSTQLACQAYDF